MEPERLLIVVAHPDDETIGAGIRMSRQPGLVTLLHVTDGSPRDLSDARANGFQTREQYSAARRNELQRAMALIGIEPGQCLQMGIVDGEAPEHVERIAHEVQRCVGRIGPCIVLTHPYEGGHRDHDAIAQACALGADNNPLMEFTSYQRYGESLITGRWVPGTGEATETIVLSDTERRLKQAMFDCFVTQRRVLEAFSCDREQFRPAPAYHFPKSTNETVHS